MSICDSQEAMPETPIDAMRRARDLAMKMVVVARVPECGEFAAIAQDLDWAIDEMESR